MSEKIIEQTKAYAYIFGKNECICSRCRNTKKEEKQVYV